MSAMICARVIWFPLGVIESENSGVDCALLITRFNDAERVVAHVPVFHIVVFLLDYAALVIAELDCPSRIIGTARYESVVTFGHWCSPRCQVSGLCRLAALCRYCCASDLGRRKENRHAYLHGWAAGCAASGRAVGALVLLGTMGSA